MRKRTSKGPSCYSCQDRPWSTICKDGYDDKHRRERLGSPPRKHQEKKNQVGKYHKHEVDATRSLHDGYEESKLSDSGEPASGQRCGALKLNARGRTCTDDGERSARKGGADVSGSLAARLADLESRVLSPEGEAVGGCDFSDPAALFTAECDVKVFLSVWRTSPSMLLVSIFAMGDQHLRACYFFL